MILRSLSVLAVASMALAAAAQAAPLNAGGLVSVPQTATFNDPNLTAVASSTNDFTGFNTMNETVFTGTLTSMVDRLANNTLAFTYFFANTGSSTMDPIERFNVSGFAGFTTSVEQGTAVSGQTPASSASRTANGNVVSFSYGVGTTYGPVNPGTQSRFVRIYTNATDYKTGSAQFINGGVGNVSTFVPQAVPEPASMAALACGAVALVRRRKKA